MSIVGRSPPHLARGSGTFGKGNTQQNGKEAKNGEQAEKVGASDYSCGRRSEIIFAISESDFVWRERAAAPYQPRGRPAAGSGKGRPQRGPRRCLLLLLPIGSEGPAKLPRTPSGMGQPKINRRAAAWDARELKSSRNMMNDQEWQQVGTFFFCGLGRH